MNVIVTLTTIPSRLSDNKEKGIKSCIKSLVEQSYHDYEIHFNIPTINKNTKEEYIIPDWLLQYNKIKIFRTDDLGPITKCLPTIQRLKNPEDILIVVDDDLVYHADLVKEQVNNQIKWSEYCVGYDGLRSRDESGKFSQYFNDVRDYFYTSNYRDSRVDILQHYKSVSYKRKYFEEDFFDFIKNNYFWNDDILISAYMSFKKRIRYVTYHSSDKEFKSHEEWVRGGGVTTFPVLSHTHHEKFEGCNIFRELKIDNEPNLYKFIDCGYNQN